MYKLNQWLNKPEEYQIKDDKIEFCVLGKTDFWQVTHYGFSRTDGNCYVTKIDKDIEFSVKVKLNYIEEFDQAGVIIYYNEKNFAKLCIENQLNCENKLGSVVCKDKRSDWATQPVGEIDYVYYRVSKRGVNYLFEYSFDGKKYHQTRLFDIPAGREVSIGIFGASPLGDGFLASFEEIKFGGNKWYLDSKDIPEEYKNKS